MWAQYIGPQGCMVNRMGQMWNKPAHKHQKKVILLGLLFQKVFDGHYGSIVDEADKFCLYQLAPSKHYPEYYSGSHIPEYTSE